LHQGFARQDVLAAQEQGIDSIGGGFGGLPILGLLLFEQPDAAILDGGQVAHHRSSERFDHQRLRSRSAPDTTTSLARSRARKHAHLLVRHAPLLDGLHDVARS